MADAKEHGVVDEVWAAVVPFVEELDCGIFDTENVAGDAMELVARGDGWQAWACFEWRYLEVFGLGGNAFAELRRRYMDEVTSER